MTERSDFEYRVAIFRYKLLANVRERFRKRQEARKKPRKKGEKKPILDYWIVRFAIERKWFHDLPQTPEINLNLSGNGRRYIIKCYPGKSKPFDETVVTDLESAWLDYKRKPTKEQRQLVLDFIVALIRDAADAGHVHDLSDTTNRTVAGLFRGYKISYAQGKESPLADLDRSDPLKGEWVYRVHGSTIPYMKLWEDNRRYVERSMGTDVAIDQPEDCPDAIRIRPKRRIKSQALPTTGGTHATEFVIGIEAETRKKITIPIDRMRHIAGIGTPGAGKTALLEGMMLTALGARELVEAVYYIDVAKRCSGLEHVEGAGAKFARDLEEASGVISAVWETMEKRIRAMEAAKKSKYVGRDVFLYIDEAAQVFDNKSASKEQQARITSDLIRLSQLSRAAGIRLITFTQKPTLDFIPTSYLDNHEGRICLRVLRKRTATDFMNVDFEWDPSRFADGEFAMLWPGWMRERYGRGFISDKMR